MPHIQKTELPAIMAMAQSIADHCLTSGGAFDTEINFPTSPLVANRKVTIRRILGEFVDAEAYSANSSITLDIPAGGIAQVMRKGHVPSPVVVVIASAIAHELVHERQEISNPGAYWQVVNQQRRFDGDAAHTPREWFDGYYHSTLEREAHATQAAVALWTEAQLGGRQLDPAADLLATEALRRPLSRLEALGGTGDGDIDDWWIEVVRLAKADILAFI